MSDDNFQQIWTGRIDDEEELALACRLHQVIKPIAAQGQQAGDIAIVGFCSDEGVRRNKGRVGARKAPNLLRKAMANIPWPVDRPVYDAGNVVCQGQGLAEAHLLLAGQVQQLLDQGLLPVVLGGGHEVAYGSWLGLFKHVQQQLTANQQPAQIGIINFDAHFDLRKDTNGASSGTPFYQIAQVCQSHDYPFKYSCLGVSDMANTPALFQRADELGVLYVRDSAMTPGQLDHLQQLLGQFIDQCDVLYLTIDLDVLPAYMAPGVSAPAARGVTLEVLEPLIQQVVKSGKLKLADMAEYNPDYDIDQWTARIAARLFRLITG